MDTRILDRRITAAFARGPQPARGEWRNGGTPHLPHRAEPPHGAPRQRPDGRDSWWLGCVRHTRALLGASLVLAALIVLLWQGSLLVLGLAAFGIGVLLPAGVVLILRLAARRSSHRPNTY